MTCRGCSWLPGEAKEGRFVSPRLITSLGFVIIVSGLSGMDLEAREGDGTARADELVEPQKARREKRRLNVKGSEDLCI